MSVKVRRNDKLLSQLTNEELATMANKQDAGKQRLKAMNELDKRQRSK